MLVLSRKLSQQILIGSDIRVTVVKIERNQVRLGIQAPPGIPILRDELTDRRPWVSGPSSSVLGGAGAEHGLVRRRPAEPSRPPTPQAGDQTPMTNEP